ncbi:MAG TPA: GTP 3',8-cyclase MoaA [Arenimonas sp.]|nr:GTP 3',8-cyclase MoaA [Arenimonas sp.]
MAVLTDRFGRQFPYLRLSLLEACNFHCSYCLPNGYRARDGQSRWLSREEITRLLRAFTAVGLRKLRLTGGEPSLRTDLTNIIADAASMPGLETIAMTTNGILLPRKIAEWQAAGLNAINISVDSLDRNRFHTITGHDRLPTLLEGIETALSLPFKAVKLNAVLLRGLNDDELPTWLSYLHTRKISIRFIELMQTGDNKDYFQRHHLPAETLKQQLTAMGWQLQARSADAGPALEFGHPDYAGRIGIIAPYSKDFCVGCNRLRVTATGDLRLCLFGDFGISLRPLLQNDEQQLELVDKLRGQLGLKAAGHDLINGNTGLTPHLASIGG